MSQTKAQLIQPIGVVTAGGVVVTGVVTASSFTGDVVGSATSIISGGNLNLGDVNATTFSGDFTGNATGINTGADIKVGQFTASSFTGDFTGTATSMMRGTGFEAGDVNATGFHVSGTSTGNITGDVTGNIVGNVTGNVTGNVIAGTAGSVASGGNIHVGVMTATSYVGDGSNLTGIAATNYNTQTVTTGTATTTIDLSAGNVITLNAVDTTVSFANTSEAMELTVIRNASPTIDGPAFTTGAVAFRGSPADSLDTPNNNDYDFGTGAYTLECFVKTPNGGWIIYMAGTNDTGIRWSIAGADANNPGQVQFSEQCASCGSGGSDENRVYSITSVNDDEWHHIAIARGAAGTTTKMWIDGIFQAESTEHSNNFDNSNDLCIAHQPPDYGFFTGIISNLKVVKGTAIYTGTDNFTPPTGPLTNTTGTSLLCLQSDSSATAATVIPTGESLRVDEGSPTAGSYSISFPFQNGSSITWPGSVTWNGGSAPTLITHTTETTGIATAPGGPFDTFDKQQFQLLTRDSGVTWYGWEPYSFDAPYRTIHLAGYNASGTMGQNDTASYSSPVQLGTDNTWPTFMDNGAYACNAVKNDNTLWVWGSDSYGQLGLNGLGAQSSPIQIPGSWKASSQGNYVSGAIKTDGTLWTWGYNNQGALGQNQGPGTKSATSSPKQVGANTNWQAIHMDNGLAVGTKTDGTLWAWGNGQMGAIGNNLKGPAQRYSSPVQVGEDTDWGDEVGGAWSCLFAYKQDGTVWIWGSNTRGQLGQNQGYAQLNGKSSPTQLSAGAPKKWRKIVGGYTNYLIGVKSDDTLFTWGQGDAGNYGNLGLNQSNTNRSTPTQIPGTNWSDCSASAYMSSATKTDGTLWSWGYNHQGQLAHNDTQSKSSPTQVPGTDWKNTNNPLLGNLLATK